MRGTRIFRWALALALASADPVRAETVTGPDGSEIEMDSWSSFSMQAKTISGELRWQDSDFRGARDSFRDSLNASVDLKDPHDQFMGLDLFRTAQLAAIDRDYPGARRYLRILINRYPGSQWAERGRRLLALMGSRDGAPRPQEGLADIRLSGGPESVLNRIQEAVRAGEDDAARALCRSFVSEFPRHPFAEEAAFLAGALSLRLGDTDKAVDLLRATLRTARDPELRSKAGYLLAAAHYEKGDFAALRGLFPGTGALPGRNRWDVLSEVWLAAADEIEGDRATARRRAQRAARSPFESPVRAYAIAQAAADDARSGRLQRAQAGMTEAVREARRWRLDRLEMASRISLGHILYGRRLYDQAASAYAEFETLHHARRVAAEANYYRGLALKRAGRTGQAAAAFGALVKDYNGSDFAPKAHLQLGQIHSARGRTQEAIRHYEAMAAMPASGPRLKTESELLIAREFYNAKEFRRAIPIYASFLERRPDDPRARQIRELLLTSYWMGDRGNPAMLAAADLYPRVPIVSQIRWSAGKAAFDRGDFRAAERQFAALASDFPESPSAPDAWLFRGQSLAGLGDARAAAAAYKALAARFPKTPQAERASFLLGAELFKAGNFDASQAAYAGAAGGDSTLSADARFNRALALSKAGRAREAVAEYWKLMKAFPRYERASRVWFEIGALRESLGLKTQAIAAYRRVAGALRGEAIYKAGLLWERLGKLPSARKEYEKLRKVGTGDPYRNHGLLRLGLLYERAARPMEAFPLYETIAADAAGTKTAAAANKRLEMLISRGFSY